MVMKASSGNKHSGGESKAWEEVTAEEFLLGEKYRKMSLG